MTIKRGHVFPMNRISWLLLRPGWFDVHFDLKSKVFRLRTQDSCTFTSFSAFGVRGNDKGMVMWWVEFRLNPPYAAIENITIASGTLDPGRPFLPE